MKLRSFRKDERVRVKKVPPNLERRNVEIGQDGYVFYVPRRWENHCKVQLDDFPRGDIMIFKHEDLE